MATWILTASPENHEATAAHGFSVIGLKERNRNRALEIEQGDRIVLYLTRVMRFAASIRVTGDLYEDREKIWPGKPGKADAYPWRFATEPELVLAEAEWLEAESVEGRPRAHPQVAARALEAGVPGPGAQGLRRRRRPAAGAHALQGRLAAGAMNAWRTSFAGSRRRRAR